MSRENNNFNTDSGSASDFGFAYQRLAFVKTLVEKCFNLSDSFEYEVVDDISSLSKIDELCSITYKKTVTQCKTGYLSYDSFLKMFENWALIDNQDEYILLTEKNLIFEYDVVTIKKDITDNITNYMTSGKKKSKKSLLWRLANKYGFKDGFFPNSNLDSKIDYIFSSFKTPIVLDYETMFAFSRELFVKHRVHDCKDNKTICERRFDYLISKINTIINNNESKRVKTVINYTEFYKIIDNSIIEINENKPYLLNYVDFKKSNYKRIFEDKSIMNSLEGTVLNKVFENERLVVTYLILEYYYRDLRENYICNNENDKVDYAETTAFENFLETKKKDDLREYFDDVVNKSIESPIIVNSQYQKGCYVFLSSESCDRDVFIDWSDANEK
jgi:hypothetical protein